ncbi:uncharacterized protein LOC142101885 [Mixophyes fleayi]|uniref:uncharacterized protein LOC142101885 n=1 Tax=Mixophyes fleayi TaxID=3061075 RepID=UPI003F4DBE21
MKTDWSPERLIVALKLLCALNLVSTSVTSKQTIFRSKCYSFYFPSGADTKTWPQASEACRSSGGSLTSVDDNKENMFLADAYPEDNWYMWLGLQYRTSWKWTDGSSSNFFAWQDRGAVLNLNGYCGAIYLSSSDPRRHGLWFSQSCITTSPTSPTGFICKSDINVCQPDATTHLQMMGGFGPSSSLDIVLSVPMDSICRIVLKETKESSPTFLITLNSSRTRVTGNASSWFGGLQESGLTPIQVYHTEFTWGMLISPSGVTSYINYQEHLTIPGNQVSYFQPVNVIEIAGGRVTEATLGYLGSFDMRLPAGPSNYLRLDGAIQTYLTSFTLAVWIKSTESTNKMMCVCTYSLKSRPAELALFTLSPTGLSLQVKGTVMINVTEGSLLDGRWHHMALTAPPYSVFIDGFPLSPVYVNAPEFEKIGVPPGGSLVVGQFETEKGDFQTSDSFTGDISELNIWDHVLSPTDLKLVASTKVKWKYPGNLVSWMSLMDKKYGAVQMISPGAKNDAPFMWSGSLYSISASAYLCVNASTQKLYMESTLTKCINNSFWAQQENGRLRNIMIPASCVTQIVLPGSVLDIEASRLLLFTLQVVNVNMVRMTADCTESSLSTFRMLRDGRIQNLNSGFCLTYSRSSKIVELQKCSQASVSVSLLEDADCPKADAWKQWKNRCIYIEPHRSLSWQEARNVCQKFEGSDLVTLYNQDKLNWLKSYIRRSSWIGLNDIESEGDRVWANGSPLNPTLYKLILFASSTDRHRYDCVSIQPGGFWADNDCSRQLGLVCESPARTETYIALKGKYYYGALSTEVTYSNLKEAQQYCATLGSGCSAVVTMLGVHYLYFGHHFANLEDPEIDSGAVTYIKSRCPPGYSGTDCQTTCPVCEFGLECNPATALCDGLIFYRKDPDDVFYHIKCPPFHGWSLLPDLCVRTKSIKSKDEAYQVCKRFLHTEAKEKKTRDVACETDVINKGGDPAKDCPFASMWNCERPMEAAFAVLPEKLLISTTDTPLWWKKSLKEAQDTCYMMTTKCSAIVHLNGIYYAVNGSVITDSPGSAATLYLKTACALGYLGKNCEETCPPCHRSQICNPVTKTCDGFLRCVRRYSHSCTHGLVNLKCPQDSKWWFWRGHCYYIETADRKSWSDGNTACSRYKGTGLLVIDSIEEKLWVSAMISETSWTGLNDVDKDGRWTWGGGEPADTSVPWLNEVKSARRGCIELDPAGKLVSQADCAVRRPWICERDEGVDLFQEFPAHALLMPVTGNSSLFSTLAEAKVACVLELQSCSGVTQWDGGFVLVTGKRLIASTAVPVTAYLKAACTPGFYGIQCSKECDECPHGAICNPATGLCDNLVTCVTGLQLTGCQKAVSLECPQESGWWYWDEHCYFISEGGETKSWDDAKFACSSYRQTWLLTINSLEEKDWVSSMIEGKVWTGLSTTSRGLVWSWVDGQRPNISAPWFSVAPLRFTMNTFCVTLSPSPAALSSEACLAPNGWVCEQTAISTFEQHQGMVILKPLPKSLKGHGGLGAAVAGCLAHLPACTGITVRQGLHYAVTGTDLVKSTRPTDIAYLRSACSLGFTGPRCAQRCPVCFKDLVCNSVRGVCQGTQSCVSTTQPLTDCPFALTSVMCPGASWRVWKEHCYYIETTSARSHQDSSLFCERFRETKLMNIDDTEEKNWALSAIQLMAKGPVDKKTTYWLLGSGSVTSTSCPVLTAGGEERSTACQSSSLFICEGIEGLLARCPADPRWQHWRGSCYFQDPSMLVNWAEAGLICKSYTDTDLLYIESPDEKNAISVIFKGSFWTGLNDQNVESVFVWTTGDPISVEVSKSLKDDMADGGLKDCALINTQSKMLTDSNCDDKRPFICKCREDTDWFVAAPRQGLPGDLSSMFPVEETLSSAKETCHHRRSWCYGIIQDGTKFYLVTSGSAMVTRAGTTAYIRRACTIGISGKQCIVPKKSTDSLQCDCNGSIATSLGVVCNVPVMDCVLLCLRQKLTDNCSKCVPVCPATGAGVLKTEEVALVSMMEFKAQQFLANSSDTDVEPQSASKNILCSFKEP